MKQNTVIFDVDGLISYPDFADQIVSPLEEKGVNIVFWVFNSEISVGERLREIGLEKYAVKGRCIGSESLASIDDALYLYRTQGDIAPIVKRMSLAGLSTDNENLQRFLQECNNYVVANKWGVRCKFPPLLGDDNYLLVESDSAMYIPSTNRVSS